MNTGLRVLYGIGALYLIFYGVVKFLASIGEPMKYWDAFGGLGFVVFGFWSIKMAVAPPKK